MLGVLGVLVWLLHAAPMWQTGVYAPFANMVEALSDGCLSVRGRRLTVVCRPFASLYGPDMHAKLSVSSRGLVVLPSAMLEAAGIRAHDIVIAETTPEGILLRPAVMLPVESYLGERIAEFDAAESEMAEVLGAAGASAPPLETRSPTMRSSVPR